jgi:hypothetical protein
VRIIGTLDELFRVVEEAIQGGALFTSTGGAQDASAGSSAWSSAMNQMTDEDEEGQGLWQNQLAGMNLYRKS